MRSHRLRTMVVAAGALLSLTAAGCSGFSSGYSKNPDTVTYLTWESPETNALLDKGFADFPDKSIKVSRVNAPSTAYNQKLSSMTLAQKLPDFFWCNIDSAEAMGREGLLYDWSAYAKKNTEYLQPSKFAPNALQTWYTNGGHLYGIPTLTNTYGFYYNKAYFAKAHLPLPTTTWSWNQLFTDIKKLNGVNGVKPGLQLMDGSFAFYSDLGINLKSYAEGGKKLANKFLEATKVSADSRFISATKQFSALVKGGYVTPPTTTVSNAIAAFGSGKVGLLYGGQWLAPQFLQGGLKASQWGFAPMPAGKRRVQPSDPQGICSPSNIKSPDKVWKVMSYLESHVLNGVLAAAPVAPAAYEPASVGFYKSLEKSGAGSTAAAVRYEMQTSDKIPVRYVAPWSTRATDVTNANWNNILLGRVGTAVGIHRMYAGIQKVIDDKADY